MFRAGLLLNIRWYYSVHVCSNWNMSCVYVDWQLAESIPILPTASQHKRMTHTNCCIYRKVPPDDEH